MKRNLANFHCTTLHIVMAKSYNAMSHHYTLFLSYLIQFYNSIPQLVKFHWNKLHLSYPKILTFTPQHIGWHLSYHPCHTYTLGKILVSHPNPTRSYATLSKSLGIRFMAHFYLTICTLVWKNSIGPLFTISFHIISSNPPFTTQPYTWQIFIKPYNLYIVGKIPFVHFSQNLPISYPKSSQILSQIFTLQIIPHMA